MKKVIILFIILYSLTPQLSSALSETEVSNVAQKVFEGNVPIEYRNEYIFTHMVNFGTTREFNYARVKNNIPVYNDHLYTWIDVNTGKVIQKYFPPTYYPITVDTTPFLTENQVKYIIENNYGKTPSAPFHIFILGDELVYRVGAEGAQIAVNAKNGTTKILAVALGNNIKELPTHFELSKYLINTGNVLDSLIYLNNIYRGVLIGIIGIFTISLFYIVNRKKLFKLYK